MQGARVRHLWMGTWQVMPSLGSVHRVRVLRTILRSRVLGDLGRLRMLQLPRPTVLSIPQTELNMLRQVVALMPFPLGGKSKTATVSPPLIPGPWCRPVYPTVCRATDLTWLRRETVCLARLL